MIIENLIIGSGPTGLTVANELLNKGKTVHLIDIGNVIEESNKNLGYEFLKDKNFYKFIKTLDKNKIIKGKYNNPNLKYPFGSDFVFRNNNYEKIFTSKSDYITSNAIGGLSNIWLQWFPHSKMKIFLIGLFHLIYFINIFQMLRALCLFHHHVII